MDQALARSPVLRSRPPTAAQSLLTRGRRLRGEHIFYLVIVSIALFLVLAPMVTLIYSSFLTGRPGIPGAQWTLENYITAYTNPRSYQAILNSFLYAGGGTLISVFFAIIMAWAIERTNMPLRNLAFPMMLVPLAIPGMLFSISWILLLSPDMGFINNLIRGFVRIFGFEITKGPLNVYTLTGMIFLEGIRHVPTIFLMISAVFRNMDPALEEAAFVSGCSTAKTLRKVTIPILFPAILVAAIYSFMTGIESFEIPGIIGLPANIYVFSTRIYWAANAKVPPDFGLANAFSVTFLVVSIVLLWLYQRSTRHAEKYATVTGKGYRPRVIDLGKWKWVPLILFGTYFLLVVGLPFFILLWASFLPYFQTPSLAALPKMSWANYQALPSYPSMAVAIQNTLLLMLFAATGTMLFSFSASWISIRSKVRGSRLLDILTFIPHTVPGVVIGLSLLVLYLGPLSFIPIYGTLPIVILALVTRYMAFGTRTANSALIQVHKELEEAAYVSGVTPLRTLRRVVLPLILPAFMNGWVWVAVHAIRETSMALMLFSQGNAVISSRLWFMWGDGEVGEAAALGVLLIATLILVNTGGRYVAQKISER